MMTNVKRFAATNNRRCRLASLAGHFQVVSHWVRLRAASSCRHLASESSTVHFEWSANAAAIIISGPAGGLRYRSSAS